MIAIFILLLLVGLAVPSMRGLFADKRLHRSMDQFNNLVREAHERSLTEHRAYMITWNTDAITLEPQTFLKTDGHKPLAEIPVARTDKWQLSWPAALTKKQAPQWIFWESGACEPVRIKFTGPDGSWAADYPALTALGNLLAYAPR